MRGSLMVGVLVLGVLSAAAQETPTYRESDNPFQEDLPFELGQPLSLLADVGGLRLATLTIRPRGEVQAGSPATCEVQVTGSNQRDAKVEVDVALLLEDEGGKGIDRMHLEPFKVKAGRDFSESAKVSVQGSALLSAKRIYVYIEVK
jgi:hypothetical protein